MQRRFKVTLDWNEDGGGYTVTVPGFTRLWNPRVIPPERRWRGHKRP